MFKPENNIPVCVLIPGMFAEAKYTPACALVLMYHKINSVSFDPWKLAVSRINFEKHLAWLKENYSIVSIPELLTQLRQGTPGKKMIALTFDDGYADNYTTAWLLLQKFKVPATFFICSKNIESNKEFWWDELAGIFLGQQHLPARFTMEIGDKNVHYNLQGETFLNKSLYSIHRAYFALHPVSMRSELYLSLWEIISPLCSEEQERLMDTVRSWAGITSNNLPCHKCMTVANIGDLSKNSLCTIGCHTVSHLALSQQSLELTEYEVNNNRNFLENITGLPIAFFSYPSGDYNTETKKVVAKSGFEAAFTTNEIAISPETDFLELGRVQVKNWNVEEFNGQLVKWFET